MPRRRPRASFGVTDFDRIRVDGPFKVTLKTGVAPFASASGSAAATDRVSIEVQGRTLIVHPNASSWGGYPGNSAGPVEIAVGTHDLSQAWLNGSGSLSIDRVDGLTFALSVQGSPEASPSPAPTSTSFKSGSAAAAARRSAAGPAS